MGSEFDEFILDQGIVGIKEEPFRLKSGRKSHWYVNWRGPAGDAWSMDKVAQEVAAFVQGLDVGANSVYGVPEGATILGHLATAELARTSNGYEKGSHNLFLKRYKPKEHGDPKDRYFVGNPTGGVVVLEDVTTTGGSLVKCILDLQETNINVVAAVGLTNRMELNNEGKSVEDFVMDATGVQYSALSKGTDLLPVAYARQQPGAAIGKALVAEFAEYGVEPLKLNLEE